MFSSIVGKGGMEQLFENKELNVSVRTARKGYANARDAIKKHVWEDDKCTLGEIQGGHPARPPCGSQPNTVLITEQGLYQLIFGSEIKRAKEFRRWVFRDVLPSIRKTRSYELPEPNPLYGKQLKLLNETDLHYVVVRYIRKHHPNALVVPGLGEYQDTVQRRCDAYRKGYIGGQPDLIITNPMNSYNGFAIELKTPKGTGEIRDNQVVWLKSLRKQGHRTLISNEYTDIVLGIDEYFRVDNTAKHKKEMANLKRQCNKLKKKLSEEEVVYHRPKFTGHKY
ncbi:phage repressor [Paramuricea clavata]|uniref:Phage repressor n=1 Tax=Paramuricea clavata TaxID=317549 RepID=A0A6S7FNN1_PARCT|nr:phage repressor [Paramuricea clavata]